MPEYTGTPGPHGRVALLVSRYHERITRRLADGALARCREAGLAEDQVDLLWVAGAFELGLVAEWAARSNRYQCLVALGVVVRGETPHFDYVAGEASRMLAEVSRTHLMPVGFGLLTTETMAQAEARAGGPAGNKGYEAAEAALALADLVRQF